MTELRVALCRKFGDDWAVSIEDLPLLTVAEVDALVCDIRAAQHEAWRRNNGSAPTPRAHP